MRKANKIVMMTVAILLSAVLLTTSALSGTLAKYVTSGGSYSDSARVAKWGVKIYIDPNEDVLNSVYEDFDASKNMKVTVHKSGTQATVVITNLKMGPGDNLRDMLRIRFDGTAEVKLQVKVSQGILYGTDDHINYEGSSYDIFKFGDDEYYVPIGFTFDGMDYNNSTKDYKSVIGCDYAVQPWCYGKLTSEITKAKDLADIGMNKKEDAYMAYVAGKFEDAVKNTNANGSSNAEKRDAYITKTFVPNSPIVFKTKSGSLDVDTLAFGLEWPFQWPYANPDGEAQEKENDKYDELATEFARKVAENPDKYYIMLVYNISITQLNK